MKVTVLQENLARGLSIVSKAVSPRSTLPVLANVLIASDEGRLRLSATNLEMGITCWIPARIDEEGSTTVPARTFSDLVSTLPGDQVLLKLDPATQTLNVRGGTSTNDIKCIDAQEFPPMPVPDFDGAVQINVGDFRGGHLTAIMGGCNVDLRGTTPVNGEAVLDVFALMGGMEIRIPRDWTVVTQCTPVLGGYEDKTTLTGESKHKVIIRGNVFLGGIEVKN